MSSLSLGRELEGVGFGPIPSHSVRSCTKKQHNRDTSDSNLIRFIPDFRFQIVLSAEMIKSLVNEFVYDIYEIEKRRYRYML